MHKVAFVTVSVSVFLVVVGSLFVAPVRASPLTIRVPTDYPTIRWAIGNASDGDIIEVASGTYHEHVVVGKSLTLVGESSSTTIIDGDGNGTVVLVNASDVEIRGFTIRNGGEFPGDYGIGLFGSNCVITDNVIRDNLWGGILVGYGSSNNVIYGNTIANNSWGVYIPDETALNNTFYHNNFINNTNHAQSFALTTRWDNGEEGNYWDDYTGVDRYSGPDQNEPGSDSIGDSPYEIWYGNQDRYPLMTPWSPFVKVFDVVWEGVHYLVSTFSNSTVTHFIFTQTLAQISFNVSGTSGTLGYCNVTIPKNLLRDNPWTITIDGVPKTDFTQSSNDTHTFLYFNYTHSGTNHIVIKGTWVVPEFSWRLVPIFLSFWPFF